MKDTAPTTDGTIRPCEPPNINLAMTEPDANGHQWMLITFFDGTMSTTTRMPWQVAPNILAQAAQYAAQLAQKAQVQEGPKLVVPPAGVDLSKLNLRQNGNGHNGSPGHGRG